MPNPIEELKKRRKTLKKSQKLIAKMMGISTSSLSRIENSKQDISLTQLFDYASALDLYAHISLNERVFITFHGKERFKERFGYDISNAEIRQLVEKMESGDAFLIRKDILPVYEIDNKWIVFNPRDRIIVTIYPPNYKEIKTVINKAIGNRQNITINQIMSDQYVRLSKFTQEAIFHTLREHANDNQDPVPGGITK